MIVVLVDVVVVVNEQVSNLVNSLILRLISAHATVCNIIVYKNNIHLRDICIAYDFKITYAELNITKEATIDKTGFKQFTFSKRHHEYYVIFCEVG